MKHLTGRALPLLALLARGLPLLALAALLSCSGGTHGAAPPFRAPSAREMATEAVVVNYAPRRLRVFPDRSAEGRRRYVILASERPELPATWRPLGVSERQPSLSFRPVAGDFVWTGDHVISSAAAMGAPFDRTPGPPLLLFDRDGKPAGRSELPLPAPCTVTDPPLLQAGRAQATTYALLRCAREDRAYLLTLDDAGHATRVTAVPGAGATEVLLHDDDGDYLLGGRKVLRVDRDGRQTIGTVPPPGGGADTRALLRLRDDLLVIIDGAIGRIIRMDPRTLSWRGETRFSVGPGVERLRAVASGDHLMLVVAEHAGTGVQLFGIAAPLTPRPGPEPPRLLLGTGPSPSNHELVPIDDADDGGGALLVRTHPGNTGPLVGLVRLRF